MHFSGLISGEHNSAHSPQFPLPCASLRHSSKLPCQGGGAIYYGLFEKEASMNLSMHQAGGMQPTSHIGRGLGLGLFHQLSDTSQAAEL